MKDTFQSLSDLDRAHLMHPVTEFRVHEKKGPQIFTGGNGIRLETADGRSIIDGFSGLFNINVGHGRTEIGEAVAAQMKRLSYYPSFWNFSNEPAIKLGERLAGIMPAGRGLDHFMFTTGGSDANETAFRMARLYHAVCGEEKRQKILSRRWSYHGITRAAGSATTLPAYHIFAAPDPLHIPVAAPYCFRCEFDKTYPGCSFECAEDVAAVIKREGPDTVAALVAEPVLGTGGIIPPPAEYFPRVEEICRANNVLLILDEVITGFGRTGKWFAMEHWNTLPDFVSMAKGITSGYLPLGAVAANRKVYETIRDKSPKGLPFMGGLTYNNHPTSCAAALANIDIIEKEGLVENSKVVGDYMLDSLRSTFAENPMAAEIRGLGMFASIECAMPGTKEPAGGRPMVFPAAVASECYNRGLIARALWENISLSPPLCTTKKDIDEIISILVDAMEIVTDRFNE
ncbi:MAG: aspartate aminotransferase family protein [Deltaproteobacteria bacterium]|nr:aspartate aminotransferase family protein [Deltaproteobacteria bacterium]